jgi:hypothetical protein
VQDEIIDLPPVCLFEGENWQLSSTSVASYFVAKFIRSRLNLR